MVFCVLFFAGLMGGNHLRMGNDMQMPISTQVFLVLPRQSGKHASHAPFRFKLIKVASLLWKQPNYLSYQFSVSPHIIKNQN